MTIQSRSPRSSRPSLLADRRGAAAPCASPSTPSVETRVLGLGGSTSRIVAHHLGKALPSRSSVSNGVVPVSSSYSRTPRRRRRCACRCRGPIISACSGLMYAGVPIICRCSVNSVFVGQLAVASPWRCRSRSPSARARRRASSTSTFDGLMSRWMMPFWCACWIAWQTGTNSSRPLAVSSFSWSQYSVIGTPLTNSITKYGVPVVGGAGVEHLGDVADGPSSPAPGARLRSAR